MPSLREAGANLYLVTCFLKDGNDTFFAESLEVSLAVVCICSWASLVRYPPVCVSTESSSRHAYFSTIFVR